MDIFPVTIDDIAPCCATITNAVDNALKQKHNILAEDSASSSVGYCMSMNASSIQTKLIQLVGRFCESYASDLLITLSDLQPFISQDKLPPFDAEKPHRWIIGVGIRELGVDGNNFILSRLKETQLPGHEYVFPHHQYRKVLALEITDEYDKTAVTRKIKLVNITNDLYKIAPEDK